MKKTIKAFLIGLGLPVMLCCSETVDAGAFLNDITVKSQQTFADGKVNYHYKVINNSNKKIVGVAVGYDYYLGIAELKVFPVG